MFLKVDKVLNSHQELEIKVLIEKDFSKNQWAMEQWFKKVIHA
ncbi:hypothetical protein [Pelosinus baikalensis]|nr:hypothetical protein [Pelosinus baikalensis]